MSETLEIPALVKEMVEKRGWDDYKYFEQVFNHIDMRVARRVKAETNAVEYLVAPAFSTFQPNLLIQWEVSAEYDVLGADDVIDDDFLRLVYKQFIMDVFDILEVVTAKMTKGSDLFHPVILPEAYEGENNA
jgi:hypothetical protein